MVTRTEHPAERSAAQTRGEGKRVVVHVLTDLGCGGGQRLVLEIASRSTAYEHHVCYLDPDNAMERDFTERGVPVHSLGHGRGAVVRTVARLARLLRRYDAAVVHAHGPAACRYARVAALMTGVACLLHLHALHSNFGRARALRWWVRWALDKLTAAGDAALWRPWFVACSQTVWSSHRPYLGATRRRILLASNGVDVEGIARASDDAPARREAVREPGDPVLVTVSRLVASKRVRELVPVMERVRRTHPGAVLLVAGDGPDRDALERDAALAGLGEAIVLLGRRDDVPAVLARGDVFVFCSRREGSPLAVAEAMAAGLPVAAWRVAPIDGLVDDDRTGALGDPADEAGLASAVLRILDRPDRGAMGIEARKEARVRLDVAGTVAAVEDAYERCFLGAVVPS